MDTGPEPRTASLTADELALLATPMTRCSQCKHLTALHNTHCCAFCLVCGRDCDGEPDCLCGHGLRLHSQERCFETGCDCTNPTAATP